MAMSEMCPAGHSAESAWNPGGVRKVSALSRPDPTRPVLSTAAFPVVAVSNFACIVEDSDVRERDDACSDAEEILEALDWGPECGAPACHRRAAWIAACLGCGTLAELAVCGLCRRRVERVVKEAARRDALLGGRHGCRHCGCPIPPVGWRRL